MRSFFFVNFNIHNLLQNPHNSKNNAKATREAVLCQTMIKRSYPFELIFLDFRYLFFVSYVLSIAYIITITMKDE